MPFASIVVFPNIDHFGASFDGYQYVIYCSNDGANWVKLFEPLTVAGSGEPFTIGTFAGTAPFSVNNVLTPGAGPGGTVGYEASFVFDTAYQYYAFGASTVAIAAGNADQELSAVAAFIPPAVTIQIKPDAPAPVPINLQSGGVTPVAILSTPHFDATLVDPATILLSGAPVRLRGNGTYSCSPQDVN